MKKVFRYLQDQGAFASCTVHCSSRLLTLSAVLASDQKYSGSSYLSPKTKEPQQQVRHHSPSHYKEQHISHHQSRSEHPSTAAHSFPAHTSSGAGIPKSNGQRDPSPPAIPEKLQRDISRHQYAQDNILQSYELYMPKLDASHVDDPEGERYWVIYVHGGYFRDPAVTSSSFYPALAQLVSSNSHVHHRFRRHEDSSPDGRDVTSGIAGYASLNYRLSPHSETKPQEIDKTSSYEARNAQWPDHIHDVLTAIKHLQTKYGFGERYLLVGHSVGATMAVLSTLAAQKTFTNVGSQEGSELPTIAPPVAVLGVSGIYDFALLHDSFPSYGDLTRNAIPDAKTDVAASPARYSSDDYVNIWAGGNNGLSEHSKKRALVLAHSHDDGLVDWKQLKAMEKVFAAESAITVKVIQMTGKHNDIWERGTELARAILEAIRVMRDLEQKH